MEKPVRIMPCLDMQGGRVVKGVHFEEIRDAGDPVECANAYCAAGADELALLDITATVEKRGTLLDVVRRVADAVSIPFSVGGGINSVAAAESVLSAGADRVSVSSAAYRHPELVPSLVKAFGPDQVIVAIDVDRNPELPSGYEVYVDGGRTATGTDALEWARQMEDAGAATLLPTSKATDGVRTGYDLPLIRLLAGTLKAEIVASGGAGELAHFHDAAQAGASVLLAASVFHFNVIAIPELKEYLREQGVCVAPSVRKESA